MGRGHRIGRSRWVAGIATSACLATGLLVTTSPAGAAANAQGVTATSINVGSIATTTGTLASDFYAMVPGVQAYFDMVNAQGGVNGRKLNLAYKLDDGGNPSQFNQLAHTLVNQDHAFAAVGVSTAFFSPGYFKQTGIPTFGYNVTGNWQGPPNLFAAGGSVQYLPAGVPAVGYVAKRTKSTSIAILAYGIAASANACKTLVTGLKKQGFNVSYNDLNIPYGAASISSDVQRMQQAGVDMVATCMDITGNIAMSRAIHQYGMADKVHQLWLNGADQTELDKFPDLMSGVYFEVQHVPFTSPLKYYPGLALYLKTMKKYEPKYTYDEVAVQGWQSAALFVAGVKAAGDNLTWKNVINQIHKLTDFTANGLSTPVNWSNANTKPTPPYCQAYIQAKGDKFVNVFGKGRQVFVCFGKNLKPVPVKPAVGTPGT